MPLSVLLLTDSFDDTFEAALKSVAWADEIVVGDHTAGGDPKRFAKLSDRFPLVRVPITQPHPLSDFSAARNKVLHAAHHNWCLWLDSDEQLTSASAKIIQEFIRQQTPLEAAQELVTTILPNMPTGLWCHRQDIFQGRRLEHGDAAQWQIRVFRKKGASFVGRVHEQITIAGFAKKLPIVIEHHAHKNITAFIASIIEYADVVSDERLEHAQQAPSISQVLLELLVFPPAKLCYMLIFQLGILDGWRGVVYAFVMTLHSLSVRIFLYEKLSKKRQH